LLELRAIVDLIDTRTVSLVWKKPAGHDLHALNRIAGTANWQRAGLKHA